MSLTVRGRVFFIASIRLHESSGFHRLSKNASVGAYSRIPTKKPRQAESHVERGGFRRCCSYALDAD